MEAGSCSRWARASPRRVPAPRRRFFEKIEVTVISHCLYFRRYAHICITGFLFLPPPPGPKLFWTQNVLFRPWFIRQRTEESCFRYLEEPRSVSIYSCRNLGWPVLVWRDIIQSSFLIFFFLPSSRDDCSGQWNFVPKELKLALCPMSWAPSGPRLSLSLPLKWLQVRQRGAVNSFLPAHFLLIALGSPGAASAEMNQDSA